MNREQAWKLLRDHTQSEALIKHALAVEAAMRYYARLNGEDEERWGVVGLIHDFDYEENPGPPGHTQKGAEILRAAGVDEEIVGAMLSHADWNRVEYPLDSPIRKTLAAVDELCGFITAVALVRPDRLEGMEPQCVRKKMKDKRFAAAVSREDIQAGAELLGVELNEHIRNAIAAMQTVAEPLGLAKPS